jgi:protein TonB
MSWPGVLRFVLAIAIATVATASSLLAVVWMTSDPEAPPVDEPAALAVYEIIAPPPVDEAEPAPVVDTAPSPAASAPSEAAAAASAPPRSSALSSSAVGGFAPSAIGGLPVLGSGFVDPGGAPPLPVADDAGGVDTPARPLSRPAPKYPRAAQRSRTEGHVIVRLRVDERGRVVDVVVVEATPPGVFDEVAVQTAKTYRFTPARRGGKAISTTVQQRIVFRLAR